MDMITHHFWIYVKQIFVGLTKVEAATTIVVVEIQDRTIYLYHAGNIPILIVGLQYFESVGCHKSIASWRIHAVFE